MESQVRKLIASSTRTSFYLKIIFYLFRNKFKKALAIVFTFVFIFIEAVRFVTRFDVFREKNF